MLKLREVNIRWPWLKVVFLVEILLVIGLGVMAVLRNNCGDTGDVADEIGVSAEVGGGQSVEEVDLELRLEKVAAEKLEVRHILTGKKLVALTFDDGPSKVTTTRLLEILQEKDAKVNFFLIGRMVEGAPELLQREVAEGHEVGSHTVTHTNLAKATNEVIRWEDTRMREIFREVGKMELKLMRPPYGLVNEQVRTEVSQPMILWSVDPEDWKYKDSAEVVRKVEGAVFDGAIILLHDIYATTVDAVGEIIDDLREEGYEFVTVSELAEARNVRLEKGKTYRDFRP